jgi:hypothetical protein
VTTPAVNYTTSNNRFLNETWNTDCNGSVYNHIVTSPNTYIKSSQRPASVNSPKDSSGFRYPTGWYNYQYEGDLLVAGEVTAQQHGICPDHVHHQAVHRVGCGAFSVWNGVPASPPGWLINQATTKAYLALKNQKVNFGVMFAEHKETSDMFEKHAKSIANSVKKFRSSNPKMFAQAAASSGTSKWRNIPNAWLELQYGWKPLMSDLFGASQELSNKGAQGQHYTAHVKGHSRTKTLDVVRVDFGVGTNGLVGQDISIMYQFDSTVRLWYNLNSPTLATFSSLGLTNPLELVWEKLPYSFVVDWFLPIGNWLSTLDADLGWSFKTGCQSDFSQRKVSGSPYAKFDFSGWDGINYSVPFHASGTRFNRATLTGPPGVGLPHFKNPFSAGHIANASSLLATAFRRNG